METQPALPEKKFLSTYALITAQRIFEYYKIFLSADLIRIAIKGTNTVAVTENSPSNIASQENPNNFYRELLQVSLRNISNGRIIDQVHDYQTYIQKLFIDYYASDPGERQEGMPGWPVHLALQEDQKHLAFLGDKLLQQEIEHRNLIARTQKNVLSLTTNFNSLLKLEAENALSKIQSNEKIAETTMIEAINYLLCMEGTSATEQQNKWEQIEKNLSFTLNIEKKEALTLAFTNIQSFITDSKKVLSEHSKDILSQAHTFKETRGEFYKLMQKIHQTIKSLPKPISDLIQSHALENRASLYFGTL